MKRVIAYIDGYNLHYGLLKGTQHKWLDLVALAQSFLRPDQELGAVKYFTAPIKTHPHDLAAIDRQKVYLQALSTCPSSRRSRAPIQSTRRWPRRLTRVSCL